VTKLDEIGKFKYREPLIPDVGSVQNRFPLVTLLGDQSLKPLFPYFQEIINAQVELDFRKDHILTIQQVGDQNSRRFKLILDNKKIIMLTL